LFDPKRELFTIGFNATERRRDTGFYDLLASESRLLSFVAIAQGQVKQEHWFSLGRLLLASRGDPVLASWSGSMFEYLMPLLVMPNYENTLLGQTLRGAVKHQIGYGKLRGVPWGISESQYNRTDILLNYQYRAFGVPGLGLKRGLAEDLVIAPYASLMALMVAPREACENLERLAAEGREGAFGFYEAVDYTPSRLPPGADSITILPLWPTTREWACSPWITCCSGGPCRGVSCPAPPAGGRFAVARARTQNSGGSPFGEPGTQAVAQGVG